VGTSLISSILLRDGASPGPTWKVSGLADFNHDGYTDVLFQQNTGKLAVWFFRDEEYLGSSLIRAGTPVAGGWNMVGPK